MVAPHFPISLLRSTVFMLFGLMLPATITTGLVGAVFGASPLEEVEEDGDEFAVEQRAKRAKGHFRHRVVSTSRADLPRTARVSHHAHTSRHRLGNEFLAPLRC